MQNRHSCSPNSVGTNGDQTKMRAAKAIFSELTLAKGLYHAFRQRLKAVRGVYKLYFGKREGFIHALIGG